MNEAFEKILERLEELIEKSYYSATEGNRNEGIRNSAYHRVKKIVQETAEEYKKNDYVNEIQDMALELAVYVLEEELWKYAWLENANNETGVVLTYKDAICIIKDMLKGSETDEEDI